MWVCGKGTVQVRRRICAVASIKEMGTMQTSALTAEPSVYSAFIGHLGLVKVRVLVPGVSGKKRDPLLCFCITSQSLVSLEHLTPDPSLGLFPLYLSDSFPCICHCMMWWLCKWSYYVMFCAEKCCENEKAGEWGMWGVCVQHEAWQGEWEVALGFCTCIPWGTKCHHLQFNFCCDLGPWACL